MNLSLRTGAMWAVVVAVLWPSASLAFGVNWVVEGRNGNDANGGISPTGGPDDLAGLDFTNAFKTIRQATSVSGPGDFIFVNAGVYNESVVPTANTTLVAVGEAVIEKAAGNTGSIGVSIGSVAPGVTIDGFTVRNFDTGVQVGSTTTATLRNLAIYNCQVGLNIYSAVVSVYRCVVRDCSESALYAGLSGVGGLNVERSTFVYCGAGVYLHPTSVGNVVRNNIIAFNVGKGLLYGDPAGTDRPGTLADFNDVFGNGTDYYNALPGPHDMSVDPQFVDSSRRILHLQPGSPLINYGEELGGGPRVTIGAREIGQASSQRLDCWSGWVDENCALVTSGASTLVEVDSSGDVCTTGSGHIVLKSGVNRASVRSPVRSTGVLKSVEFAALEDHSPPSGSRGVVDQLDATNQRELRYRAASSSFGACDALPAWQPIFEGQELDSPSDKRFVQVELTLTKAGL